MSNETNIEENIKFIEKMIEEYGTFKDLDNPEFEDTEKIYKAIKSILADRKRLKKENKELIRDNFKLKIELENKRKEYQETYKDVREELKELKAKANKYDSLVEKIKDEIDKEELPLVIVGGRRNSKTLNYGIKLGRKQVLQELLGE